MLATTMTAGWTHDSSPRWLVSNGDTTVGPVHTELLLRGYLGGRIPEHCHVREVGWGNWRPLAGIREIGSLKRKLSRGDRPLNLRDAQAQLPTTRDPGELFTAALHLSALALEANAGLLHRQRGPLSLLVTSAVFAAPAQTLGDVIAASDPSYQQALRGRSVCGNPHHGLAERLIAERLQHEAPITSVASAPILVGGQLVALLELGRADHAFRADDADDLAQFAAHVAGRLAE